MKRLLMVAGLLVALTSPGATLLVPMFDSQGNALSGSVTVSNRLTPQSVGGVSVLGRTITKYPTNGVAVVSNLVASSYLLYFNSVGQTMRVEVPDTNGVVSAPDVAYAGNGTLYYWLSLSSTNAVWTLAGYGMEASTNGLAVTVSVNTNLIATRDYVASVAGTGGSGDAMLDGTNVWSGTNTFLGPILAETLDVDNLIASQFTGSGAGLTNLSASALASGTLADARLSSNVLLRQNLLGTGMVLSPYDDEDGEGIAFIGEGSSTNLMVPYTDGAPVLAPHGLVGPLSGTNLLAGTVNSNALDTATQAWLRSGGSGDALLDGDNVWTGSNYFSAPLGFSTVTVETMVAGQFIGNGSGLTNSTGYAFAGLDDATNAATTAVSGVADTAVYRVRTNLLGIPAMSQRISTNIHFYALGDSWSGDTFINALLTGTFLSNRVTFSTNLAQNGIGFFTDGISGGTNIMARYTNVAKPMIQASVASGAEVIVSVLVGLNDGMSYAYTPAPSWVAAWSNLVQSLKDDGAKVLAYTIPASALAGDVQPGAWYDVQRLEKNAAIRRAVDKNGQRLWTWLADLAAVFNNARDTRYYASDLLHLTTPGEIHKAGLANNAMLSGADFANEPIERTVGTLSGTLVWGDNATNAAPFGALNFNYPNSFTNAVFIDVLTNATPEGFKVGHAGSLVLTTNGNAWLKTTGTTTTNWYWDRASMKTGWARVLIEGKTTAWSGPTNSVAVAWPWLDYTIYSVTSDCEITNLTGWTDGQRRRAALQFTNATTSNCTIRLPLTWWRYGPALSSNQFTLTNGGKMFKLDIEAGTVTNAVGAYAQ